MINVAFFSNHASIIGGGELSFIDLVDSVRQYDVQPLVFVPDYGEVFDRIKQRGIVSDRYRLPQIRIHSIPTVFVSVVRIIKALKSKNVHVVHANGARCMLIAGFAAYLCRIPVVWHVRVIERDVWLDKIRSVLATLIIANSFSVKKSLESVCKTIGKIRVVYNGIDTDKIRSTEISDIKQVVTIPDHAVVLAVGRLCSWKRFHILIEACKELESISDTFTCLIIGQDAEAEIDYSRKLRNMPRELNLKNVKIEQWRNDIISIMKAGTMLVVPSDNEPFGRVVIEAWACGLPVIATNAGGPSEIITNEINGLLVPVDNVGELAMKIKILLRDKELRTRLSEMGREKVAQFSLAAHAKKISELLFSIR